MRAHVADRTDGIKGEGRPRLLKTFGASLKKKSIRCGGRVHFRSGCPHETEENRKKERNVCPPVSPVFSRPAILPQGIRPPLPKPAVPGLPPAGHCSARLYISSPTEARQPVSAVEGEKEKVKKREMCPHTRPQLRRLKSPQAPSASSRAKPYDGSPISPPSAPHPPPSPWCVLPLCANRCSSGCVSRVCVCVRLRMRVVSPSFCPCAVRVPQWLLRPVALAHGDVGCSQCVCALVL